MSANNFIKINRNYRGKYVVRECDADTGATYSKIFFAETLEDAIREANRYMMENEVEYGLSIELPAQKETNHQ